MHSNFFLSKKQIEDEEIQEKNEIKDGLLAEVLY